MTDFSFLLAVLFSRNDDHQFDNTSYLELALSNSLSNVSHNVNTVICASLLDELVSTIESNIENENNIIVSSIEDLSCAGSETIAIKKPTGNLCDINDNYELDDSMCDSAFVECLSQDSTYLDYDLKCFRPQVLLLLSTLCDEIALKTPVILELKRQLKHIKSQFISLQNRHFEQGIQVISTFVHLKNELESKLEPSEMKQTLLNKLDSEMSILLGSDSDSNVSPDECDLTWPLGITLKQSFINVVQ